MRGRRAQFYIVDAFLATIILLLGIGFLISSSFFTPQQTTARLLVADITQNLMVPTIETIRNDYTNNNFYLLNPELTVAQQAQVWMHNSSCDWCATNVTLLAASVLQAVGPQRGVHVFLRNQTHNYTLFEQEITRTPRFMIVNQQIVLTHTNDTLYGPNILEVRVWQ